MSTPSGQCLNCPSPLPFSVRCMRSDSSRHRNPCQQCGSRRQDRGQQCGWCSTVPRSSWRWGYPGGGRWCGRSSVSVWLTCSSYSMVGTHGGTHFTHCHIRTRSPNLCRDEDSPRSDSSHDLYLDWSKLQRTDHLYLVRWTQVHQNPCCLQIGSLPFWI